MRRLIAALVLTAAAGCGGGPDADALRKDVAQRLGDALPSNAYTLVSLDRRGSQSDSKAPAGETRRTVYFDAALRLERDLDLGAWDAPGVAGLISTMGAGPKGISGLVSGGNKAGDVIRVHGTALYKREADQWVPVVAGGFRPPAAPAVATGAPQSRSAEMLESMRGIIDSVPDAALGQRAIVEEELAAAGTIIRGRLARASDGYAIAAGPEHGQYLRFAQAVSDKKARTIPLVTRGGEENLRLLRQAKVSLALSQGDAALDAYEGRGSFAADGPHAALRAVGSLYPEPVHVMVRVDSPYMALSSLRGRRIAIGLEGSASRTTALRVLAAHGLHPKDFKALELTADDALVGLQRKELDAVVQVIGVPADSVRDALAQIPARLLSLSDNAVATLVATKGGYFRYNIPRGAYSSEKGEVHTVATAALLLVGSELSASEVGAIARYVYGKGRDLVARGSAQGAQVSAAHARQGLSVPMHAASAKALDELAPAAQPADTR